MHSANTEEQIPWKLSCMIGSYVQSILQVLHPSILSHDRIGKKLRHLSGKMKCNFSSSIPITGKTRTEIQVQVAEIIQRLKAGFVVEEAAEF